MLITFVPSALLPKSGMMVPGNIYLTALYLDRKIIAMKAIKNSKNLQAAQSFPKILISLCSVEYMAFRFASTRQRSVLSNIILCCKYHVWCGHWAPAKYDQGLIIWAGVSLERVGPRGRWLACTTPGCSRHIYNAGPAITDLSAVWCPVPTLSWAQQ